MSAGNWAYTNRMPIIPVIEVGLTPVLQFAILPVLVYGLTSFLLLKFHETSHRANIRKSVSWYEAGRYPLLFYG